MNIVIGLLKLILKIVAAPVVVVLTVAIWMCVGIVYLSTGAAQYGGCSVGRGSNDYLLSTKRHHSAGDGIPYQPIRSANGSHLVIG